MTCTVRDNATEQLVSDREQLRGIILSLHKENEGSPKLIQLISSKKTTLTIAVGSPTSIVNFIEPDGFLAKTAVGDETAEGILQYRICNEVSEFPARFGIPFGQALDAALDFFQEGRASSTLTWIDD